MRKMIFLHNDVTAKLRDKMSQNSPFVKYPIKSSWQKLDLCSYHYQIGLSESISYTVFTILL